MIIGAGGKGSQGRGRAVCWSPVLAQRAASEGPRWTRAIGDQSDRPLNRRKSKLGSKERIAWMVPFARRVRTIRMCSLDARGEGPIQATLADKKKQTRKDWEERVASRPSCSQNAHDEAVLVRRAQWRITGSRPSERGVTSELGQTILMVSRRYALDFLVDLPSTDC